jgi:replicative DNA helicase
VTVVPIRERDEGGGPVPPQNLEAEESVLGAMMLSPGAIAAVSEILDPSDFYYERHGKIYRAALALDARGEPVDAITLTNYLESTSEIEAIGGRTRIHELAALVPASANAAHYAKIVHETATFRGLIQAGAEISRLGWERPGEADELVDRAGQLVFDVAQSRISSEFVEMRELLTESFQRVTKLYESGEQITGTPSGFPGIDRITSGFQDGNLVIVAGRPSMGKSALAAGIIANLAVRYDTPVALFTIEMSRAEMTQRLMAIESTVELQRIRNGQLAPADWPRLTQACNRLERAPVFVDDNGSITMPELRAKARRVKARHPNLGLIVVDYLQLMASGPTEYKVAEVGLISRGLKVLARELEIPVLALSQLNRGVEQRENKRPMLSDLRESGALEQDADVVIFVYRDEVYNKDTAEQGIAELIVAKHRNGPTDTTKLAFMKRYARFANLQEAS